MLAFKLPIEEYGLCKFCNKLNVPTITFACCFNNMLEKLGPLKKDTMPIYYKTIYTKYFEGNRNGETTIYKSRSGS